MKSTLRLAGWLGWAVLFLALSLCAVAPRMALAQDVAGAATTGLNFSAIDQNDTTVEVDTIPPTPRFEQIIPLARRGFSPPDTIGSVGPHHIVEMTNGAYAIYDKTTGTELASGALSAFWKDAGVEDAQERPAIYDPVVQYDPDSKRWFPLAEDGSFSTVGDDPQPSRIHLAVSNSSDPTAGWKAYTWASNPPNTDPDKRLWADQALLGFNHDGVFIASNMFYLGGDEFPPDSLSSSRRESPLTSTNWYRVQGAFAGETTATPWSIHKIRNRSGRFRSSSRNGTSGEHRSPRSK
ncbi:MAG: hypothetical protein H0U55_16400 [Rubrobacteraceae bacterium]|nr:hypothetical protein [Rubrobacteraceae bacterium]